MRAVADAFGHAEQAQFLAVKPTFRPPPCVCIAALQEVRKPHVDIPVDLVAGRPDARGATIAGTQIHSVRIPSFVVSTEIVFGAADERLSRHHAAGSAAPYVTGVLLAVRRSRDQVGLIRGLDRLLLA